MPAEKDRGEPSLEQRERFRVPYTGVHAAMRRLIESAQDILVVVLALVLFATMGRVIFHLGTLVLTEEMAFRSVLAEALFVLVLIELQRLLVIYLRDHHVSVDVMVEVAIVSVLREVALLGTVEIEPLQLVAITAFVLALGSLLRFGDVRASARRIHCGEPHGHDRGEI